MSFLIDPPLLILSGLAIFLLGRRLNWSRHAKIVVGLGIAIIFIAFSSLLYADIIRCTFPLFSGQSGSEFMLHTNFTQIHKNQVPQIAVLFLFLLYPVWIFAGYSFALLWDKRKFATSRICTYSDVKSKSRRIDRKSRFDSHTTVERGEDTRECVRSAIKKLGGIGKFVNNGDRVLVKVNICGGVPEKIGTFTSIDVADELCDLIRSAGGEPTFADADMVWIKFQQAARDSGYIDWAEKKRVRLVNLSETTIVNFDFGPDSALGTEKVSMEAITADVIISVPTMKTHLLTAVTLAMKNMYGTFPDIDKAKFHKKSIEDVIFEINSAFTPNLVIIDGSIGGEAIGPLSADPVYYQTIIASDDVVQADSIASQMMGYQPMEIVHIRKAHEAGLGDASVQFDFNSLPYPHAKDGMWDRPKTEVKDFYEWAIEVVLMFPGWQTLFNVGADFLLYDLSRLPVFKYLMPAALRLLQDIVYPIIKENKSTAQDVARRVININLMVLLALGCGFGYYLDGYFAHSSLLFEISMAIAIAVGFVAAARMKTIHLAALLAISGLVSYAVEHTNTHINPASSDVVNMLVYNNRIDDVTLFIVCGWMVMMISILQVSDLLCWWLKNLGIFASLKRFRLLPIMIVLVAFGLFFLWEGYLALASKSEDGIVLIMYAVMAILGLIYSSRHSIEWNASLLIVAIFLGGYMELTGSLAGLWSYPFHEKLAIFFALTWPLNTMTVHAIAYLMGVDLGAYDKRSLLKKLK